MAVSARLSPAQGRKFAFTLVIAFLVLGLLSMWRGHEVAPYFLFVPAGIFLLAGLLVPTRLGPIKRAWMGLGHRISLFMAPVILAVIYFGALTLFGLAMRMMGKRPLTEHHKKDTAWVPREGKRQSNLKRQF
jgi:hypothetical protein